MSEPESRPVRSRSPLLAVWSLPIVLAAFCGILEAKPGSSGPVPKPTSAVPTASAPDVPGLVFEVTDVDQTAAEQIFASADAALYLADLRKVRWFERSDAPVSASQSLRASSVSALSLSGFEANVSTDFPGFRLGAHGQFLLKLPVAGRSDPRLLGAVPPASVAVTPRSPRAPLVPSLIFYDGFEQGISPNVWNTYSATPYLWGATSCDAHQGSKSADAVRAGSAGATLSCSASYPNNTATFLWDAYCESGILGLPSAWLDGYLNLSMENGNDYLYFLYGDISDASNEWGYSYTGNSTSWFHAVFDLTNWYHIGDLTRSTAVPTGSCPYLIVIFVSDAQNAPGFGARIDDVRISQFQPLDLSISPSPASGAAPLTVNFAETVTPAASVITTYSWEFGDPSNSTASTADPSFTYTTAGDFLVHASVTDSNGNVADATAKIHVTAPACALGCTATVPATGTANASVAFQATATPTNCNGSPTYAWTFGDNGTSTAQNPSHTYAAAGTYPWTLTVSVGATSCTKSGSIVVTVPGLALSVSPAVISAVQGQSATATLTSTASGGFSGAVTLSASGLPAGATASFSPPSIAAPGSGTSTLTLAAAASTPSGTYPVTITAAGGGLTRTAPVSFVVRPAGIPGNQLVLSNGRVLVDLTWRNQYGGSSGSGTAVKQLDQYGYFWFTSPDNPEVFVKVLDFGGTSFLAFHSALSDLEYDVTFTVVATGKSYTFDRPAGSVCGLVDGSTMKKSSALLLPKGGSVGPANTPADSDGRAQTATVSAPLILAGDRVAVTLTWHNQYDGSGGIGTAVKQLDQYGYFWFTSPDNPEVFVKVLDFGGTSFLVFHSALSDLEYHVTFTVVATGISYTFDRPAGSVCGLVDGVTVAKSPPFSATASVAGTGTGTVTSAPAGITCPGACTATFPRGTDVTLHASPASGSSFLGWSGGGCVGTGSCAVGTTQAVTATFALPIPANSFQVDLAELGSGQGTVTSTPVGIQCPGTCAATFPNGTTVTLHAVTGPGSSFFGWGADCLSNGGAASCSFNAATSSKWATAVFNVPAPAGAVAADIAALHAIENQTRMTNENYPVLLRGAAELYNPEVVGLISAGSSAVDALLAEFKTPAGPPDDTPLCLFAYALERIGDPRAARPLADWLSKNLFQDLDFAPHFATHTIKVLSGQSGLNVQTYMYTSDQMLDAISQAQAGAQGTSGPTTQSRVGAPARPDPLDVPLATVVSNPNCGKSIFVTGVLKDGTQREIRIGFTTHALDFDDEIKAAQDAGDTKKAADIQKLKITQTANDNANYGTDYVPLPPPDNVVSKKSNCGGSVTERLINNLATGLGLPLHLDKGTAGAVDIRDLARAFGDDITDSPSRLDTLTVITHDTGDPDANSMHVEIPISCTASSCVVYSKDNQGIPRTHTVDKASWANSFLSVDNRYNFRPFVTGTFGNGTKTRLYRVDPSRIRSIRVETSACPCNAPGSGAVSVTITDPTAATTDQRVITVAGTVSDGNATQGTLRVNNGVQSISIASGAFSAKAVLSSGLNTIRVVVDTPDNRRGCAETSITSTVPKTTISATLTWTLDATDVDLYVTQPDGETSWYSNKTTSIGGRLDVDNTSGFGPENYYLSTATGTVLPGPYTVRVHYYRDKQKSDTTPTRAVGWRVDLLLNEGTPKEKRDIMTGTLSVDNPSNKFPGASGPDWATAFEFQMPQ